METFINTLISLILLLQSNFGSSSEQTAKPMPPRPISHGSLPDVSPDGSRIVFTSDRNGNEDLYIICADGSGELQLTNTPALESFTGWSADSKHIYFSIFENDSSRIYLIDIDGKNQSLIGTIPGRNPRMSPDGKRVLYTSGTWTEMRLLLSGIDGTNPQQVNDGKSIAWNIHWAPDSKRFAFTGRADPKSELAVYVANADGTNTHQVSHVPADEGGSQCPAWSADGRWIAMQVNSRAIKGSAHVWIVDVESGAEQKLAAHEAYLDETPSWFPGSKQIAFQSDRTGRMEVWVMNVDGTNSRQLTH